MTNVQPSSQQDSLGNMLSPEAKEFVPRQLTGLTDTQGNQAEGETDPETGTEMAVGQHPINGIPSYMTTCYPFVANSDQRYSEGRPRPRGKYPQMVVPQHFPPMQQSVQRNRFPNPGKSYWNQWNQGSITDIYPSYGNVPNGMPFDGGTYQNGFVRPTHIPHMAVHDPESVIPPHQPFSPSYPAAATDLYLDKTKLVNGYVDPLKQVKKEGLVSSVSSSGDASNRQTKVNKAFKICYKNSAVQTDFPPHLASSTLDDIPNSLFNQKNTVHKARHKAWVPHRDTEPSVHKKNKVMDVAIGNSMVAIAANQNTVLKANQNTVLKSHGLQQGYRNAENSSDIGSMQGIGNKNVPSNCDNQSAVFSYAKVAQSKPSQKNTSLVVPGSRGDQSSCDSSKKVPRPNAKMGYSSVDVNVVQLIEDLEKADSIHSPKVVDVDNRQPPGSYRASLISNSKPIPAGPLSYNAIVKRNVAEEITNKARVSSKNSTQVGNSSQLECHSANQGKGHDIDLNSAKHSNDVQGHVSDQAEGTDIKKKRKRRRRRKRKSGDGVSENDDVNSGANEEITLHFEDEEEFPDLLGSLPGGDTKTSSLTVANISYRDILKTSTPVQSAVSQSSQEEPQYSQDNSGASKESRNSRKRRKRREVANKAADAEMAEINLEQHMLELKMKQKHPVSTKKSVSPVRASPSQGVWKLPPSSPVAQSSSGKKVSLLLPGTVAPECPVSASQPLPANTGAKQHGILKTSQPTSSGSKKSKQPITYDLGAMIDALEAKKETVPVKKETKPVVNKKEDPNKPHNILDASAPVKRGKERETPKLKKPSPLKKVILKEREEKKRLRLLDEDEVTTGAPVGIGIVSGESDLSQDAGSCKGSTEVGLGTPASAELSPISQPSPTCMSPMSPGASPLSSGVNSPVAGTIQQTVKLKIHSRRFREYCNQVLDKEIDNSVALLLTDLVRFQDKQYHKDPVKAKAKRRFVLGLREVTKHLKLRKIKCVIISPNLEKIQSKGGLDDALNNILELCNEQKVPFVFALGRRALGRACAKLVPVSVVGVFNFEGSEENFKAVVSLTEKAREAYREMISQIEKELAEHPPRSITPGVPHIFAHMGHSRTPSGCSVISFTSSILSEPISENYPYSEPETDNRGYEIEKPPVESADINQNNIHKHSEKDPYEADDESGFDWSKQTPNRTGVFNSKLAKDSAMKDNKDKRDIVVDLDKLDINDTENGTEVNGKDVPERNCADSLDVKENVENDIDEDSDNSNDLDFETCEEEEEEDGNDSDLDNLKERADTVEELPHFIESVHHHDLNEILSQHSSKTMENGEDVMSTHSSKTTHSSRTLGDGSTQLTDKSCTMKLEIKNAESPGSVLRGKPSLDKENRTLSWVQEAQTLHFSEKGEDSSEEVCLDVNSVTRECLDAMA